MYTPAAKRNQSPITGLRPVRQELLSEDTNVPGVCKDLKWYPSLAALAAHRQRNLFNLFPTRTGTLTAKALLTLALTSWSAPTPGALAPKRQKATATQDHSVFRPFMEAFFRACIGTVDPQTTSRPRASVLECAGPPVLWIQSGRSRPHSRTIRFSDGSRKPPIAHALGR